MEKKAFLKIFARGGSIMASTIFLRVIIGFITQVFLARLLAPEQFGQIAFVSTIAMFLNSFTDFHGDKYIIHQKDSTQRALNTAFTLELMSSTLLFVIVILIAPFIMEALDKKNLTLYIQIMAVAFFYNPFNRPRSLFEKDLSFFNSKYPLIISQLIAAISSIILAYNGFGIWSLLCWRILVLLIEIVIIWIIAPRRPKITIDICIAKKLLRFSWPLILSSFLSFIHYNVDYYIIGRLLKDGDKQLGFYFIGFQAAAYALMSRQILYQVLFPIFSSIDNVNLKKQTFLKFSNATASLFVVLTIVAIIFGRDLIILIYGENWEPATFPFQIIFITIMIRAVNSNLGYYFYSQGKTSYSLVSVILSCILIIPTSYFATIYFGIKGTAVSVLLTEIIVSSIIYEIYVKPTIGKGALYFFFWPLFFSGLSLLVAWGSIFIDLMIYQKFGIFIVLILMTYFIMLKYVINDLVNALKVIKN